MAAQVLRTLLGLTLVLALACGTAAPATPEPSATLGPDTVPAPVASDTPQTTPTPQVAAPPAEVEVNPGKLTIMVGDLSNERFDRVFGGGTGTNYARIMHGYLISANERMEMVPGIAEKWGLSPDGLTWTFAIREGVKFHDGSELTAEDMLWTLQHSFGPEAGEYTLHSDGANISRITERLELSGPNQASVITKQPVTSLAGYVTEAGPHWYGILPHRAKLHDIEEENAYDNNPIGAGFMKLEEHIPASVMKFQRFDDFYYQPDNGFPEDKRVKFQSLDLFLVPEEVTRVAALQAGDADLVPVSLATREQVEAGGGRLIFGPEGVYVMVQMVGCWADPNFPCGDKRVRQALDYAIDKELIRDRLFGGPEIFQVKGWSAVTPSTNGYTPEIDPTPFDPDKARQLLTEAGYPGGQGFGKLIINTFPSTAMPLQIELAQLGADLWRRELGLDVEVRVGDSTGLREKEVAGELNGQILWRDNETRPDALELTADNYGDPKSSGRLHEQAELFRAVQETVQILNSDQRAEASKKLYLRLKEESYDLGVGYVNIPWGVGPRVVTWEPYPLALYPSALHTITLK